VDLTIILQNVLNGVSSGAVYAIFALGYTLVFSILGIINFAHTAVFTLGAYFTYLLYGQAVGFNGWLAGASLPWGFDRFLPEVPALGFAIAALLGSVLAGFAAMLIERVAFRPLRQRNADPLLALVSSLGVALVVVNVIQLLVGAEAVSFPANVYGASLPPAINFGTEDRPAFVRTVQIIIFGVSMAVLAVLAYVINRTKTGKALRAVAENPTTASLLGISTDRYILFTFFLSGFLGGLAGTLVGTSFGISGPYFGVLYGLKGLAVIILGGLGDIPGAVLGGLVIGLAEAFVPGEYSAYRDAVAFAILFIILLVRPQGLLGKRTIQKV
jgi:branched-chain amino acid transport system permease protein